ncbi:MAG: DUF3570 domain-containing protein, partial [Opitutales bacterium]
MKTSAIRAIRFLAVAALLVLVTRKSTAEKALRAKYREWVEGGDRIHVRSWYAEAETALTEEWSLDVVGIVDTWSGATPIGLPPTESDWLSDPIEEVRRAGLVTLSRETNEYDFSFEFGLSHEPDYLSRSYAVRLARQYAEETLTLSAGLSYLDDTVDTNVDGGPDLGDQTKHTPEILLGVHRILNQKTTLAVNLSYSRPSGYLSDPYKSVFYYDKVEFPPDEVIYVTRPQSENRPDVRNVYVVFIEGTRYIESLRSSLQGSYRFFADDSGIRGNTLEVQWFQRFGENLVVRPLLRYYNQSAADYYVTILDESQINDGAPPRGLAPHYSADYRISKMESLAYGLKLTMFKGDNINIDLAYERYDMKGRDGVTSPLMYPDAD